MFYLLKANTAGRHHQALAEADLLSVGGHRLLGHLVDGEPGGGVGELPQQRGGQPAVQR